MRLGRAEGGRGQCSRVAIQAPLATFLRLSSLSLSCPLFKDGDAFPIFLKTLNSYSAFAVDIWDCRACVIYKMAHSPMHSSCFATSTKHALSFVFGPNSSREPFTLHSNRTNSLGRAESDCHTCQAFKRHCDRQRPRCSVCATSGDNCGGYVQALSWLGGVASRGKLSRKTSLAPYIGDASGEKDDHISLAGPTDFAFVQETGVKRRRLSLPGHRPKRLQKRKDSKALPPRRRPRAFSATASVLSLSEPSPELTNSELELVLSSPQPVATSPRLVCANPRLGFPDLYRLSPRVSEVLDFYRWRFSFVTLTFKVQINPWHMCLPMAFDNPCLMDAIVALSRRYRAHLLDQPESLEVMHLKNRALSAFSSVLHSAHPATLVGTILTLIGLDVSTTCYSLSPFGHLLMDNSTSTPRTRTGQSTFGARTTSFGLEGASRLPSTTHLSRPRSPSSHGTTRQAH